MGPARDHLKDLAYLRLLPHRLPDWVPFCSASSTIICPEFELDGTTNLGCMLLRGVLSERELDGFSNIRETLKQPADIKEEVDNKTPTDDDWENL